MAKYFRNIYDGIYTALVGMKITFTHLFGKKVTMQYPDTYHPIESGEMPPNSRNRIFVDMDGCDGCNGCARACPVECIEIETVKVVPGDKAPPLNDGKKRRTWVTKHEIDFSKCCFCSLCTEACPTNAIYMTQEFEYSSYYRDGLVYNFAPFNEQEAAEKKQRYDDFQEQKKREKAEQKKKEMEEKKRKAAEEKAKKEAEAKNDNSSDDSKSDENKDD